MIDNIQQFDKEPFFCNIFGVSHTADEFVIDCSFLYPQFTGDKNFVTCRSHRALIISPYDVKQLAGSLLENIQNYEKHFGEIKEPASHKIAKEDYDKFMAKEKNNKKPDYTG